MARKILFHTHWFSGGGAEMVFERLARAFAAAGDEVIFAADRPGPGRVEDRPNLRHLLLGRNHAASIVRLAALIRREKPDVSFSALGAANLKHVAAALGAGRLDRCVIGYHGFAVAERKLFARLGYVLCPLVTRLAARTICVSDTLLEDMRRRWFASRARSLRIYNPAVDAATIDAPAPARDEPPLVVACGRLIPGKRFEHLVTAFAAVRPATARLTILGEGPSRAAITAQIAALDLQDRVTLVGFVDDPLPWFRRAACVAIASESESFGLTVVEALACATPVVATDCGGPAELLDHGRWGRIVPRDDPAALAEAISATLAGPADTDALQQRARDFTTEAAHAAYAALIDGIAAPVARPRAFVPK